MEHVKKTYTGPVYTPKQTGPMPQAVIPQLMPMPAPMPIQPTPLPYPGPLPSPVIQMPSIPIVNQVYVANYKPHHPHHHPHHHPVCHPIKPIAKKCWSDNSAYILVLFILLVIISSGFGYAKKC